VFDVRPGRSGTVWRGFMKELFFSILKGLIPLLPELFAWAYKKIQEKTSSI
jgi:hypothetical protein